MIDWLTAGLIGFLVFALGVLLVILLDNGEVQSVWGVVWGIGFIFVLFCLLTPNIIFCEVVLVEGEVDEIVVDEQWIYVVVDGEMLKCSINSDVASVVLVLDVGDYVVFKCKMQHSFGDDTFIILEVA